MMPLSSTYLFPSLDNISIDCSLFLLTFSDILYSTRRRSFFMFPFFLALKIKHFYYYHYFYLLSEPQNYKNDIHRSKKLLDQPFCPVGSKKIPISEQNKGKRHKISD